MIDWWNLTGDPDEDKLPERVEKLVDPDDDAEQYWMPASRRNLTGFEP